MIWRTLLPDAGVIAAGCNIYNAAKCARTNPKCLTLGLTIACTTLPFEHEPSSCSASVVESIDKLEVSVPKRFYDLTRRLLHKSSRAIFL